MKSFSPKIVAPARWHLASLLRNPLHERLPVAKERICDDSALPAAHCAAGAQLQAELLPRFTLALLCFLENVAAPLYNK